MGLKVNDFYGLKGKDQIIVGIISALALIGVTAMTESIIAGIIGFGLGYSGSMVLMNYLNGEMEEGKMEEVVEQVKEPSMSEKSVVELINLEEKIALSAIGDDMDLRARLNTILDNLYDALSGMHKNFGDGSITYELNNLASEHFPNRVLSYIALSADNREKQKSDLDMSLVKIENLINESLEVLNNQSLNKDERESLLINIKY